MSLQYRKIGTHVVRAISDPPYSAPAKSTVRQAPELRTSGPLPVKRFRKLIRGGAATMGTLLPSLRPAAFAAVAGAAITPFCSSQADVRGTTLDPPEPSKPSETIADQVRCIAANAEEVACELEARGGDEEAAMLRALMKTLASDETSGPLAAALSSLRIWTSNDCVPFGPKRSDDGHTTGFGADFGYELGDAHVDIQIAENLFTEVGGNRRTDLVEVLATRSRDLPAGEIEFRITPRLTVGVQGTGDFGGSDIQDAVHGLYDGRTLANGLQSEYTGDRQYSLVVGGGVKATRHFGPIEVGGDLEARAPIGPTGFGYAAATASIRAGGDLGVYGEAAVTTRRQWIVGKAMDFTGAPIAGTAHTPRVTIGWQNSKWDVSLGWTRNAFGTEPGRGGLNADALWLQVTILSGDR